VFSYQYSLDGEPFSANILKTTQIIRDGLADGPHTVSVIGIDAAGNQQPASAPTTASWIVKATKPVLTVEAANLLTGSSTQTIGGTVELGSIPTVSVADTRVTVGPVKTIPGIGISTWSCDISGLVGGTTAYTVIAQDFVFNTSTVNGVITRILPDGDLVEDGTTDITDALKALRIAVDLIQPTPGDMLHGDIAPLVDGKPTQNGHIDVADALLILRKTVGAVVF